MITTNVSGTTTILAILLNTTNAHASMGVSVDASVFVDSFEVAVRRGIRRAQALSSAKVFSRCEITKNFLLYQIFS